MESAYKLYSKRIRVKDSIEDIYSTFCERGWTDGLPIIPPTEERVRRMLFGCNRNPHEVVAVLPPRLGEATIENIAINAVMAGCLPDYLPVIITAVEAIAEEKFKLMGVLATTHS